MSLCIVDYQGDFIFQELLPRQPNILILCHEGCLVPNMLKATLLQDSNFQYLSQGGLFIHRVPSDFQRGCAIGSVFNAFPSSKLYTSRRELFSGLIPSFFIEFLNEVAIPSSSPNLQAPKQALNNKESPEFEEAYEETLQKFVKSILLEKHLRTTKSNSLKGQIKGLATGILGHLSKKKQLTESIDLDKIVELIVQDLESEGVIRISAGKVEYSDGLIEAYFGFQKTKMFAPVRRKSAGGVVSSGFKFQGSPFFDIGKKDLPYKGVSQGYLPERQNMPIAYPNTAPSQKIVQKNDIPAFSQFNNPALSISSPYVSSVTRGPDATNNPSTSAFKNLPKIELKQATFNWSLYEHEISERIINEVYKNEVSSCLKLFQICNRTTRDYLEEKSLKPPDSQILETVKKSLKFTLETFFNRDSTKSIDEIIENIVSNGFIKLNLIT